MRPPKLPDLMAKIHLAVASGQIFESGHALQRQKERNITRGEILFVLGHGYHEKSKDHFEEKFGAWNYSIRGKSMEERELRIVVSYENPGFVLITVIDLVD